MTRRFTSSGTRSSKQRLPASMWKTGTPRRFATYAESALSVSPRTSSLSGAYSVQQRVDRGEDLPDPVGEPVAGDAEEPVGRADAELVEEDVAQRRVEVLAGVHERRGRPCGRGAR